jgi:hypothetical protein
LSGADGCGKSSKKKKNRKTQSFNSKECGHIRKYYPTYNKTNGAANIDVNSAANSEYEVLALVSKLFDEVWVLNT